MKIVVIDSTGLIESRLVSKLRQLGHEVVAASPTSGINATTGEGLDEALKGSEVVVNVANSSAFEENSVEEFFHTSGRMLLVAEKNAGVKNHIGFSVAGNDSLPARGHFVVKMAQENQVKEFNSPRIIRYSIQFFELADAIVKSAAIKERIQIPGGRVQPVAYDNVVDALAEITIGDPLKILYISAWMSLAIFLNETNESR